MTVDIPVKLFEKLNASMDCASKDETLYHLCGVALKPIDNGIVQVVGLDGHRMAISEIACNDLNHFLSSQEKTFVLRRSMQSTLKAILKEYKNAGEVCCIVDDLGDSFRLIVGNFSLTFESVNYPKIELLVPRRTEHKYEVAFNAELLLGLAKAINDVPKHKGMVKLMFGESNEPILIEAYSQDYGKRTGVLMPCRLP